MKRGEIPYLKLAKKEWKKEKREKNIHRLLITLSLISFFLFILIIVMHVFELTGYSTSITSKGGYVTEVGIKSSTDVNIWGGFYGLVLRVPDFTQQLYKDLESGTIERSDIFFDCIQYDASGGPEFYASTNSSLIISPSTVSPATAEMVDQFINCSGKVYCANNTFTKNMTIFIGSTNITGIPSTHTYKSNGENNVFDIGILNISGNLAFVAHINESINKGFNPDVLVNYQMLLPTPANTSQRYYFYADPNDVCPSGGIGNSINATVSGYIYDILNNPIENATVSIAGYSVKSNASGFYNLSTIVLEGTYKIISQKSGYDPFIENITINFSSYVLQKNITLIAETPVGAGNSLTPLIFGFVNDTSGVMISGVNISLGNSTTSTNSSGEYSFRPLVTVGQNPIIAIKVNYDNYYALLNFTLNTSTLNYNITLEPANLNNYPTGPYTTEKVNNKKGYEAKKQAENFGQDFWISASEINKQVRENTFTEDAVNVYNFRSANMQVFFTISSEIEDIVKLDKNSLTISPDSFDGVVLTISGTKPIGIYRGILKVSGDLDAEIPVKIEIVPKKLPIKALEMSIDLFKPSLNVGGRLKYRLNLKNLLTDQGFKVSLKHLVMNSNGSKVYMQENEEVDIKNSLTLLKDFRLPENISEGEYLLSVEAQYLNLFSSVSTPFTISKPIYLYSFFGIPLWIIFIAMSFFSFIMLNALLYKRHLEKKKRYHLALNLNMLPKPGDRSIKLGKIAERNDPAYYNLDDLTTHAIIAGATGGGKSISAQVFVEEALLKGISVIVFDPTAQWSGMLRKCEDKKMLASYPKFGLKPQDAKAFPGNVRQITNEKEAINIKKYINPGQIQIFTLNKLDPSKIDFFVAGAINSIFKSDPKENSELKVMLVFDEVHRLLPKFGGSGKGFLQIERACREFRKWGFGVMLVSQVLSDFVGEIKANINTEVQMRVAEENDLKRIQERYGPDSLKSLVRADVGTGMIQNAEYNKGLPYFVSFRPILHNTRRLSDEDLDKYNKYNEVIDDLEYQIEQLEKEKVDTFDLKMELKLVKNKLMNGNFTVVDIYLEGLKPRIEKQWETLGKKPKKREIELINPDELESSLAKVQKERQKWEKEESPKKESTTEEKSSNKSKTSKIVAPITFDNGNMASSLKELKEILPVLDDDVFSIHVNDNKNDISDWVEKEIDSELGKKLKPIKDKNSILKIIEEFEKEPVKQEKIEDKIQPDGKKEEVTEKNSQSKSDKEIKEKTKEEKSKKKEIKPPMKKSSVKLKEDRKR